MKAPYPKVSVVVRTWPAGIAVPGNAVPKFVLPGEMARSGKVELGTALLKPAV